MSDNFIYSCAWYTYTYTWLWLWWWWWWRRGVILLLRLLDKEGPFLQLLMNGVEGEDDTSMTHCNHLKCVFIFILVFVLIFTLFLIGRTGAGTGSIFCIDGILLWSFMFMSMFTFAATLWIYWRNNVIITSTTSLLTTSSFSFTPRRERGRNRDQRLPKILDLLLLYCAVFIISFSMIRLCTELNPTSWSRTRTGSRTQLPI